MGICFEWQVSHFSPRSLSLLKYCGDAFMLQDEPGPQKTKQKPKKKKKKKKIGDVSSQQKIYI